MPMPDIPDMSDAQLREAIADIDAVFQEVYEDGIGRWYYSYPGDLELYADHQAELYAELDRRREGTECS
jgi:hypothetical protein